MLKRVATLALISFSIVSAKTYTFTVSQAVQAGTQKLSPGEYKLKLEGSKVTLEDHRGHAINAPAKLESANRKYSETAVEVSNAHGASRLDSIELRGTTDRVVVA